MCVFWVRLGMCIASVWASVHGVSMSHFHTSYTLDDRVYMGCLPLIQNTKHNVEQQAALQEPEPISRPARRQML